ncbi:unnamed protein product [Periconia digitata]|uniref:Uncharacterized protein n=1 Tax=Periconia digitata TaxID=1303443 RepID=A0A9W4UM85_9PLEO|nr:unnamed protein product [Periconia digitata]
MCCTHSGPSPSTRNGQFIAARLKAPWYRHYRADPLPIHLSRRSKQRHSERIISLKCKAATRNQTGNRITNTIFRPDKTKPTVKIKPTPTANFFPCCLFRLQQRTPHCSIAHVYAQHAMEQESNRRIIMQIPSVPLNLQPQSSYSSTSN